MTDVRAPSPNRVRAYLAARFPVVAYLPLVLVATAAALLHARAARVWGGIGSMPVVELRPGAAPAGPGIDPGWLAVRLAIGALTMLGFFFLLRVLDEHKDAEVDARYRPELPVPSGLVTLRELRLAALVVLGLLGALNGALDPALLLPILMVLGWSALMAREFFVRDWLRARPLWYLLSHMVVMPLILLYATSLDWLVAREPAPAAILILLGFSFLNGLIIEIGRKLKAPADEREGVDTYTGAWGVHVAGRAWLGVLAAAAVTGALAIRAVEPAAAFDAGVVWKWAAVALGILAVLAASPAARMLRRAPAGIGARVELASGLWVLASYVVVAAASWAVLT